MKLSVLNMFIILLSALAFCSCVGTLTKTYAYEGFDDKPCAKSTKMGISKDMIPKGDEDLYIRKSQIVPPVCPACPSIETSCPVPKPCTPCPPCGRCPEPSFDCKKVPNYNAAKKNKVVPRAVLTDFSSFGM